MRIFAALFLPYVLSIFYRSFLSVIAENVMADLAIGPAELGLISAAWFIAFAAMQFPVGWALDRIGPRLTVSVLMAAGVAGAFLFAAAKNAETAMLAMALIGVGCSSVFMSALYLFARASSPEKFAGVASLFIALGSVGNLIGASPLARAAEYFGWRASMMGLACLFAIALVGAASLLRDPPRAGGEKHDVGLIDGLKAIMSMRVFWLIAPLTFVSYALLATVRGLWIAPYLAEVNGFSRAAQGDAALLMAVAMTVGALAIGRFERNLGGPKPTMVVTTGLMILFFIPLPLFGHQSGLLATILYAAIGFIGFNYAILMAHARLFFPDHLIGRGMTFMNFFFIAGASAVQAGSGWLIEANRRAGMDAAAAFAHLYWVFIGMLAISLAIYLFAPARPADPQPPRGS